MLKNRIIPCLDVKNGRVVKGINFVDLKDAGDPVEQAQIYSDGGADEICFLDITASNENRDIIYDVVKSTSKKCFVPLTVGGGIKNIEDIIFASSLNIDYLGMIFVKDMPRTINIKTACRAADICKSKNIKSTGVFLNQSKDEVSEIKSLCLKNPSEYLWNNNQIKDVK